jgi:hypothetical protein
MNTPLDYIRLATDMSLYSPAALGARLFPLSLVTNTWSGSRPGLGTKTQNIIPVYNQLYTPTGIETITVRCQQVSTKDITLSQGQLKDITWIIGPIVLTYATSVMNGGYDIKTFQQNSPNQQSYLLITGPGLPTNGQLLKVVYDETDDITFFKLFCSNTGEQGG